MYSAQEIFDCMAGPYDEYEEYSEEEETNSNTEEDDVHYYSNQSYYTQRKIVTKEMFTKLFNPDNNQCTICLEEEQLVDLGCGHRFCRDCLEQYLKLEIQQRNVRHQRTSVTHVDNALEVEVNTVFGVVCPHVFCDHVIEDIESLLTQKEDYQKFDTRCLDEAILEMRIKGELRSCPLGCGYFVQEDCLCVNPDCRKKQLKMRTWEQKRLKMEEERRLRQQKLIQDLLAAKKKKCCPKCFVEIVKNGGCNHMYCVVCRTHFNWAEAPAYGMGLEWYTQQKAKLFGIRKKRCAKKWKFPTKFIIPV